MNNFRQLNREYDDMRENQYIAQIEEADNRQLFIEGRVAEYENLSDDNDY